MTAIEVTTGGSTVKVVCPWIDPVLALIVAAPCALACANPLLFTLAIDGFEEDQVTEPLMFCVCPSPYMPIATSCCCSPTGRDGFPGVMPMAITPDGMPVPDKVAVCGLVLALSVTVRVPVSAPNALGENTTEMVQFAPAARVFGDRGQFEVWEKLPEVEMLKMVKGVGRLFCTVTA